ncbi:hypothetical protein [Xanthocytophaga agilis]|uniref:DUF2231 domain-containing protein n=1 Tax=Xanthocytophaga agilis TaxID=3048010 RepID=A0AAE3UJ77_9BACT|nr:hypothetical protein [Xanthocytophaga agilis]MDJ1506431.1 hypothetical protein [Xanthocytophaga agilis]
MDAIYWHLVLNHIPILGTFFGGLVVSAGLLVKSEITQRVGMGIFILTGLSSVVTYFTGTQAEDAVKELLGISENLIEVHQELASVAMWLMGVMTLASFVSFIPFRNPLSWNRFSLLVALYSLLVLVVMARVAFTGGEIRHSEIRSNASEMQENIPTTEPSDD